MNDHDWLAARYVLGELDETEATRCEELLASDQSFREAFAGAVELLATTRHVFETCPPRVRASGSRNKLFWAMGIASGIAAVVLMGASVWVASPTATMALLPTTRMTDSFVSDQISSEEAVEVAREWVDQQVDHREFSTSIVDEAFNWSNEETFDRSEESYSSDWVSEAVKLDPES